MISTHTRNLFRDYAAHAYPLPAAHRDAGHYMNFWLWLLDLQNLRLTAAMESYQRDRGTYPPPYPYQCRFCLTRDRT